MNRNGTSCISVFFFIVLAFFAAAEDTLYDWSKSTEIFPGIQHAFLNTDQPRPLKINVLRIDLTRKDLGFMTAKRDPDWGKPMPDYPTESIRVLRETSREFLLNARKNGIDMLAAVNATPWTPWRSPWTHRYAAKLGLVISDGIMVDEIRPKRPSFIVTKKGEYQIRVVNKEENLSDIQLAVTGFGMILENGKVLGVPGKKPKLAPRTGYGLSKGNHYLIVMTIDGRMNGISEGVSTYELGGWMQRYGAETALNMDGGGSTTLVVFDGKNDVRKLNCNPFYRKVAASLGIYRIHPKSEDSDRKPKQKAEPVKSPAPAAAPGA